MPKFKTVVRKARFSYSGIQAQQMANIAQAVANDIKARILRAEDVHDVAAPALKRRVGANGVDRGYAAYKAKKHPPAIRNWSYTGHLLGSLKVLRADENRAVIGFTDAYSNRVAAINNRRWRQFGMSPSNWEVLLKAFRNIKAVVAKAVA